jgi:ribulose-5-phosphate 4-epimerase/fuculose-1-phosphate aldolase
VTAETALRDKLATCTRILAMQELMGLFGHISAYDPVAQRIYMSPSMGVEKTSVQADNILVSDPQGKVIAGEQRLPIEWPIHTAIHARRGDALAVAHLHSHYSTLFSITERPFRPVTLQGTIFGDGIPIYTEPHLITQTAQGETIADVLEDKAAVLMRGHGVVIVARDVEEMLYAALILEDEARKAVDAAALGAFHCFDHHACAAFDGREQLAQRSARAWRYYGQMEKSWDKNPGTGKVSFV